MSIKLYGMPLSNYYNMVKAVLIEKGMDFEEVLVKPNQDADYLHKSPMGKVPCMETDAGFLTETTVMFEYLEETGPEPSFYPADPWSRAKVRELIQYLEKYVELPARRLYGEVFFGNPASDELKARVRADLEKGFTAVERLGRFDPWIAGADVSYADFFFNFSANLATIVARKALAWDAWNEMPHLRALLDLMGRRSSIQQVLADRAGDA